MDQSEAAKIRERKAIEEYYARKRQKMIDEGTYDRSQAHTNGLAHPDWHHNIQNERHLRQPTDQDLFDEYGNYKGTGFY